MSIDNSKFLKKVKLFGLMDFDDTKIIERLVNTEEADLGKLYNKASEEFGEGRHSIVEYILLMCKKEYKTDLDKLDIGFEDRSYELVKLIADTMPLRDIFRLDNLESASIERRLSVLSFEGINVSIIRYLKYNENRQFGGISIKDGEIYYNGDMLDLGSKNLKMIDFLTNTLEFSDGEKVNIGDIERM